MEIKIKDKDNLIDATIEVVDGVMVVSPKEEKYEPKDGDVVIIDSLYPCVGIVRDEYSYGKLDTDRLYFSVGYWIDSESIELKPFCACNRNTQPNYRPATEEETKRLFDKIDAEGYEWNPDERKLVRKKWKPIKYEMFYCPILNATTFGVYADGWNGYNSELELLNKGWVFQTEIECLSFCDKLNQAINQIKP
jgi:hypothetical protein